MNNIAFACGMGLVIGVALFFILAFTGYIDKWTGYIDRWREAKRTSDKSFSHSPGE